MQIEILGSGGASTTPRPFCDCAVCVEASTKGVPYSRSGPCYFIHNASLLIDTPEDIARSLLRSQIKRVDTVVHSHWHPDHTLGMRVWESNTKHGWAYPYQTWITDMYLPEQVAVDFEEWLGLGRTSRYLEERQVLKRHVLKDGDTFTVKGITVQPFRVSEDYVYAFLLTEGALNVLIAPDELYRWVPPAWLPPLDLAILPMGIMRYHAFTGAEVIPPNHPVLQHEATFHDTLEMLTHLKTKRTILSHIEESERLSYDDYLRLSDKLIQERPDLGRIEFAYDQMRIDL